MLVDGLFFGKLIETLGTLGIIFRVGILVTMALLYWYILDMMSREVTAVCFLAAGRGIGTSIWDGWWLLSFMYPWMIES